MRTEHNHAQTDESAGARAPAGVRVALWVGLGVLMAGAMYLIAVRGEALLVDLTGLAGKVFCL